MPAEKDILHIIQAKSTAAYLEALQKILVNTHSPIFHPKTPKLVSNSKIKIQNQVLKTEHQLNK